MLDEGRLQKRGNGLGMTRKQADTIGSELVAKKLHLCAAEQTLVLVEHQALLLEDG